MKSSLPKQILKRLRYTLGSQLVEKIGSQKLGEI
jgi:hypothetical protein